jgi:hypothetical protein
VVDPEGSGGQRWRSQLCFEALPKQAGSKRSERRSAFDKRSVRQADCSNAGRTGVPLA